MLRENLKEVKTRYNKFLKLEEELEDMEEEINFKEGNIKNDDDKREVEEMIVQLCLGLKHSLQEQVKQIRIYKYLTKRNMLENERVNGFSSIGATHEEMLSNKELLIEVIEEVRENELNKLVSDTVIKNKDKWIFDRYGELRTLFLDESFENIKIEALNRYNYSNLTLKETLIECIKGNVTFKCVEKIEEPALSLSKSVFEIMK